MGKGARTREANAPKLREKKEKQQKEAARRRRKSWIIRSWAGFALIILAGTLLLMLPFAAKSGRATPFLDALFTATSATCVTGLVTVSTALHWSFFGKCVILLLIQIGGLGFMSVAAIASFVLRRTITLHERMVMSAGLNLSDGGGIVRLTRRVLFGTFIIEGTGAVLLSCRFVPHYGFPKGITMGVFHAVSAFCNAGFDLMGTPDDPFQSLIGWAEDPLVNITLMALIVLGGLGFFVWSDVWDRKCFKRLTLHSKLVLTTSGALLAGGFVLTLLFEWSNPATLGGMTLPHKLLAAAFQSVTLRTAGFNTIDESALTGPSQALACVLMLIGGSPGSTAGGLKTVTAAILALSALGALRGHTSVVAFSRTIEPRSIMNAVTLLMAGGVLCLVGACAIAGIEDAPFHQCLFEAVSAFGTVGVSMGLTPTLAAASRVILIVMMYMGRVGVLTLGVAVFMRRREPPRLKYPDADVFIG